CQVLLLGLRNTQSIKGVLNVCWDIVPGFPLLRDWLDIVVDVVEVNPREVRAPRGHGALLEECQALEAECAHPIGLALHFGDLLNDLLAQSALGLERVIFGHVEPRSICLLFRAVYLSTHQNSLHLMLCSCRKLDGITGVTQK